MEVVWSAGYSTGLSTTKRCGAAAERVCFVGSPANRGVVDLGSFNLEYYLSACFSERDAVWISPLKDIYWGWFLF